IPWDSLNPVNIRIDKEETTIGFAVGFPAFSSAFRSFSVYAPDTLGLGNLVGWSSGLDSLINKLNELLANAGLDIQIPHAAGGAFNSLQESISISGSFDVVATATPLTPAEYIAMQRDISEALRQKVLHDANAPQGFLAVAEDANLWDTLYFTNLVESGMLRPEDQPPPLVEQPVLASAQAIIAAGLLGGELGSEIIVAGTVTDFFSKI